MHVCQTSAGRGLCEDGRRCGSAGQDSWSLSGQACLHWQHMLLTGKLISCVCSTPGRNVTKTAQWAALPAQLIPQQEHFVCMVAFPLKKHFSVVLPAILSSTSAVTQVFTQHVELEFVKVEKAPLKQTISANSAFRWNSVPSMCAADVQQLCDVISTQCSHTQRDKLKPGPWVSVPPMDQRQINVVKAGLLSRHQTSFPDESIWTPPLCCLSQC